MKTISIDEARKLGVVMDTPQVKKDGEASEIEVVKQAVNELKTSLEQISTLNGKQVTAALAQVAHAVTTFSATVEQLDQREALGALTKALGTKPDEVKEWTFTVTKRDERDNIVTFKAVKG